MEEEEGLQLATVTAINSSLPSPGAQLLKLHPRHLLGTAIKILLSHATKVGRQKGDTDGVLMRAPICHPRVVKNDPECCCCVESID